MDDKTHYTLVGAFVLGLGAALVAGVLWLAAGLGGGRQAMDSYQAVIRESVSGLSVDAPVKYLGVDVGKVSYIGIDPANPQQVRLRFLIARGTPIQQDSEAVLKTQGLTGIAHVELNGGSASAPPLRPGLDGAPPTIPFKLSLGARLENVLGSVLANVDRVSNNLNAMFDADNQRAVKATLADISSLAQALAAQKPALQAGMADAARTAKLAARAAEQLAPTLDRLSASAEAVQSMADAAREASVRGGAAADAAAASAQQLSGETLPEITRLTAELAALSASLRRLSEQTTQSPNSLLLGAPPPQPGPGESAPR
jgi:phospholipid/cholesterol/gamma-HCH transport system substrate-binding protein